MLQILIIDDEDAIRNFLRRMLERAGYEVFEASNGDIGVNLYRKELPDLVITDIVMPEKDGLEVITELKRVSEKYFYLLSSQSTNHYPNHCNLN